MEIFKQIHWVVVCCLVAGLVASYGTIALILRPRVGHQRGGGRNQDFHHARQAQVSRLGGVGLIAAFVAVAFVIYFLYPLPDPTSFAVVILSSIAMFGVGFWDDLRPLRAHWKLLAQIAIAGAVYFGGIKIELLKNPVTDNVFELGVFGFMATVMWLVTLTNLINLIDGIDGLAGGISLMLMALLAYQGVGESGFTMFLALGIAGALLGFLRFNYPPAKIYMGDGGAYFLGFVIGILTIVNSNKGTVIAALIAPAFALALPLVDVGLAVLRRGLSGLPIFRADRKHIHHHLIALGFSRERAVLALYSVSLFCLFLAFLVFYAQGRLLPLFTGLLCLALLGSSHLAGFTKDWFTIGSRVGKSLALRKETRYALTLSRWLEMEVERQNSVDALWQDYQFVVRKLGFSRVKLTLADRTETWEAEDFEADATEMLHGCHEINDWTMIEFDADQAVMSEILFNLLSDLAAETWFKAASRWRSLNHAPVEFSSLATPPGSTPEKKFVRMYLPIRRKTLTRDMEYN